MSYHKNKETNSALICLLDALCMWERGSGRRSTLILIPHNSDEKILMAQDGKPIPDSANMSVNALVNIAFRERDNR